MKIDIVHLSETRTPCSRTSGTKPTDFAVLVMDPLSKETVVSISVLIQVSVVGLLWLRRLYDRRIHCKIKDDGASVIGEP